MHPIKRAKIFRYITYIFLALTIGSMIIQYATNSSLWRDESSLANNIVRRDFSGLKEPLDYGQAAPIGFLMVTESLSTVLGTSEYALRLIPLIYSILGAFLFIQMGRLISPNALIFSAALLAASPLFIRYAAEFKQYSGDAFWSMAIMILAIRTLRASRHEEKAPWSTFGLVGSIAVWFSHPVIFIMAGAGMVLFINGLYERNYAYIKRLIFVGICWIASFAVVYLVSYRYVVSGTNIADYMNHFWQGKFVRLNARSIIESILKIIIFITGLANPIQLMLVTLGLFIGIVKFKRIYVALLLMPIPFLFVASMLELYPIESRMMVFLIPNLLILTGIGFWQIITPIMIQDKRMAGIFITVIITIILAPVRVPLTTEDTTEAREAIAWLNTVKEDDPVYITFRFITLSRYYGNDFYLLGNDLWPNDSDDYIELDELPESTNQRYWSMTDAIPFEIAIPEGEYTEYDNFLNVTIYCVPGEDNPCPEKAG